MADSGTMWTSATAVHATGRVVDEAARAIVDAFIRSAEKELPWTPAGETESRLRAEVAEALLWGRGDRAEAASMAAPACATHPELPEPWAIVRAEARAGEDGRRVAALWTSQAAAALLPEHALGARLGSLLGNLAAGRVDDDHVAALHAVAVESAPLRAMVAASIELTATFRGDGRLALRMRDRLLAECGDDAERRVRVASGGVWLARAFGSLPDVVRYASLAFAERRDEEFLRAIVRDAEDAGLAERVASTIEAWAEANDDPVRRSRWLAVLGLHRAVRTGATEAGVAALEEGARRGPSAPAVARLYLDAVAAGGVDVEGETLVDAMQMGLEMAASPAELALWRTEMAAAFHQRLGLPDAAVEVVGEAVALESGLHFDRRALGGWLVERGPHDAYLTFLEQEVARCETAGARFHALLTLADAMERAGRGTEGAAPWLLRALDVLPSGTVARRLIEYWVHTERLDEACELATRMATRVDGWFEQAAMLETAAALHESAGRYLRAVEFRARLAQLDRGTSNTLSLLRLLQWTGHVDRVAESEERWADESELDRPSRVALLLRCAQRAAETSGDVESAETLLRRALDDDPANAEVLYAMESVLAAQGREADLAAVLERAVLAASTDERRSDLLLHLFFVHVRREGGGLRAEDALLRRMRIRGAEDASLVLLQSLYTDRAAWSEVREVLVRRAGLIEDKGARARLAWRRAVLDEYRLQRPDRAVDEYLDAIQEPICAPLALDALDRLATKMSAEQRERVRGALEGIVREAPHLVAEQAAAILSERFSCDVSAAWVRVVLEDRFERCPDDVGAMGWLAAVTLRAGEVPLALERMRLVPRTHEEETVIAWGRAECGEAFDGAVLEHTPAALRDLLGVEFEPSPPSDAFAVAPLRLRLHALATSRATVAALLEPEGAGDVPALCRLAYATAGVLRRSEDEKQSGVRFARAATCEPVALYRWLRLTEMPDATDREVQTWLAEAARCGAWDSPLRAELYERMESVRTWGLLEASLGEHLQSGQASARGAGVLAARRARALEELGRRDEAVDVLAFALVRCPADAEIGLAKARLEAALGRVVDARATLRDALDAGIEGADRVRILERVAELYGTEDPAEGAVAVEALEEAWRASGYSSRIARKLAHGHAKVGSAERAAELLEDALPMPEVEEDLEHWMRLARLKIGPLDSRRDGEDILWRLLEAFPRQRSVLDELQELHRSASTTPDFVDRLGDLLAAERLRLPPRNRADLWHYIGEINHSVLGRHDRAEQAFEQAAVCAPPSSGLLLRWAASIAAQRTERSSAAARLAVQAMEVAGEDRAVWIDALRLLQRIWTEQQDSGRLRPVEQLLVVLGAEESAADSVSVRDPQTTFDREMAWAFLGGGLLEPPARDVLCAAAPLLEKALPRAARPRDARRVRAEEYPEFDAFLQAACRWLEVTVPKVEVIHDGPPLTVIDGGHFLLHATHLTSDEPMRARFWAGAIAALRFSQLASLFASDDAEVRSVLEAVAGRELGYRTRGGPMWEAIGGLLLALQRRKAAGALREHLELLEETRTTWCTDVSELADRAGLLFCGDLRVCIDEIVAAAVLAPQDLLREERIRRIALHAIGEGHQRLRSEAGMDGRQWLFGA
jgi:tetratricopeptide (TPR) repeat protein